MAAKTAVFPRVLKFPRIGTEDVFLGENDLKPRFDGVSTPRFDEISGSEVGRDSTENPVSMADQLTQMMEELEAKQRENNFQCLDIINQYICDPSTVAALREHIRATDSTNDHVRYALGIQALLDAFDAGCAVKTTQLVEAAATEELAKTFLRDQVKPVLEQYSVLLKQDDGTFRWATLAELEQQLATLKPANDLQSTSKCGAIHLLSTCNSPIRFLRTRKNAKRIAKAKQDPFARVKGEQIEYLSLPYQGELTEDEKQLLRQLAKAEAREKLQGKLARLDDKEFQREMRAAEKAAMQQAAALSAEASVKAAEVIARRQVRNAKLAGYVPVVSILAVFGIVAFMISHANQGVSLDALDVGNPAYTQIQQASMDDSVPVSSIPSPEETQQQLLEMEAALQRLDGEVPAQ